MTEPHISESSDAAGELVLYTSDDGLAHVQLRAIGGTAWLPQRGIAELFEKDVRTINEHIQNVITQGGLDPSATIRKFRIVQNEGNRGAGGQCRDSISQHLQGRIWLAWLGADVPAGGPPSARIDADPVSGGTGPPLPHPPLSANVEP